VGLYVEEMSEKDALIDQATDKEIYHRIMTSTPKQMSSLRNSDSQPNKRRDMCRSLSSARRFHSANCGSCQMLSCISLLSSAPRWLSSVCSSGFPPSLRRVDWPMMIRQLPTFQQLWILEPSWAASFLEFFLT
jgi:hypothetical protein